ncbi:MAG TPA: hypothetical protein VJU86_07895 [Pyrinomonadaceae bacterium]|nr:hypothetical protein [Pyrinomonadaceae bacterium]
MKSLKMICTAAILFLALSVPTHGGEINTPGFQSDPCGSPISQPSPESEDNSGIVATSSQFSDLDASGLAAVLYTLSVLF